MQAGISRLAMLMLLIVVPKVSGTTRRFSVGMGRSGSRGHGISFAGHGTGGSETLLVCLAVFDGGVGGGGMAEQDRIGLAAFLTDLRAELSEAQTRAAGDSLKLGVEEISLTLEVAYTLTKGGEASTGVQAKFW